MSRHLKTKETTVKDLAKYFVITVQGYLFPFNTRELHETSTLLNLEFSGSAIIKSLSD
jgi:hypothetical protein